VSQRDFPTILIIHFHSSQNAGDAAQLEAAVADLREHFSGARILVAANYPKEEFFQTLSLEVIPSISSYIGLGEVKSILKLIAGLARASFHILRTCAPSALWKKLPSHENPMREILEAYREADLIVSTPGNIFFTRGRLGFLCSALQVLPGLCFKKPFYVLPQSIGPLIRWWERIIVRYLYSRASFIFLREPKSYRNAIEIGLPKERLVLTYDQSLSTPLPRSSRPPEPLQRAGYDRNKLAIGVTVIPNFVNIIHSNTLDNYYSVVANSLDRFLDRHAAHAYFFAQVTGPSAREDDRNAARHVLSLIPTKRDRVTLIEDVLTVQEIRTCYLWMDLFIATRLHSAIFSMSNGVPTLMIGYLEKTAGTAEMLDWQEFTHDLSARSEWNLVAKLEALFERREALAQGIETRLDHILRTFPRAGRLILEDFAHGQE
jgi:colanic acid/amylovoran biosynthesis protein